MDGVRFSELPADDREYLMERAAIREFDGGQCRADANRGAVTDYYAWKAGRGERAWAAAGADAAVPWDGDLRSRGARGQETLAQQEDPNAGRGTLARQAAQGGADMAGAGSSGSTSCPNSALSRGPSGKFEHATQAGVGVDGADAGEGDLRSEDARGQETFAQQCEAGRGTLAQREASGGDGQLDLFGAVLERDWV